MRLIPMMLSLAVVVMMGCGAVEENSSPAAETTTALPVTEQEQDYQPGDCCYTVCQTTLGGGAGFCEFNVGKVPFGQCTSRSEGYCQLKRKPFVDAYWGKCSSRSGC